VTEFTEKDRLRFRKLLEVANSSTFTGERDAAMAAATRLADSHGMTLREAAGMAERSDTAPQPEAARPRRASGFPSDFGARMDRATEKSWRNNPRGNYHNDVDQMMAEKRRHDAALADAIRRGLDAEERKAEERRAAAIFRRSSKRGGWRAKPEFIRVLLRETSMSAKDIAATVGVTIYDVFKEKLLMRIQA